MFFYFPRALYKIRKEIFSLAQEASQKTFSKKKIPPGGIKMALLAFYAGLLIGVAGGMLIMALLSMARSQEGA